jgi:hypothetical protein
MAELYREASVGRSARDWRRHTVAPECNAQAGKVRLARLSSLCAGAAAVLKVCRPGLS